LWANSGALLVGTVIARFSRAGAFLLSARVLGPQGFGLVATGLASYEMLRVLNEAGLDTRLIRRVSQRPADAYRDSRDTIRLKLKIAALLVGVGGLVAATSVGRSGLAIFLALVVGLFGLAISGSAVALATARLNARGLLAHQVVSGFAFLALVAGLTLLIPTPTANALAIGLGDLVGGVVLGSYLWRLAPPGPSPLERPSDGAALRESWPVGAVSILATAYARLGIAVLAISWGSAAVAQYGVSYRVVEVFLLASGAVAGSAYAVTARLAARGPDGATRALLNDILRRIALPLLVLATGVAAGARLLPIALGSQYGPAVATTRVLAFALPPMFVNGVLTAHLYGRGRYHTVLLIALGNLVVNAALIVALVPAGGPPAVALAVVATESLNTALQSHAAGLPYRAWSWPVAAVSLVAGVFAFLLSSHAS
jgi:O-antigen/teichoic acid export membrane protein